MPNIPTINVIYASDALEESEALKNILKKFKTENRIADYTLLSHVDQFVSSQGKVKSNDALITLLTLKLERLDEIRSISTQLKVSRPEIKIFEIIVDQLPYDNKFVTFPADLAPIRGRNDIVSVWNDIEKTLEKIFPAKTIQPPPVDRWKAILKIGIPLIIIIALIFWWIFRDNGKTPEQTPQAQFSSDKTNCSAPCTIVFTNASQNADKYRWDFGNGDSSELASPTYTFENSGNFIVKLIAFGKDQQHEITHEIVVDSTPTPTLAPVAKFSPSKTTCIIPCSIQFTNQSQNATSFQWDFGDGTSSAETNPAHNYADARQYQVKLVAISNNGQIDATATITVGTNIQNIDRFEVRTSGADAQRVNGGDNEIDSDDWTSVEFSYLIEIVNAKREVRLTVVWYAQERNDNKSPGNTRFKSERTFTLFTVDSCCPGSVVDEIQGIDISANKEEYYHGEVHGFKRFPDTGSLQGIEVRFDADGGQDNLQQALKATLPRFSVKLKDRN